MSRRMFRLNMATGFIMKSYEAQNKP